MTKWEYRIESINPMEPTEAVDALDRIGAEGWELVTSFNEKDGAGLLIFKREVTS
jgi:hypothetical protein